MRLLGTVGRPELVGPVTQRNLGVRLALTLIAVIVGLDLVGGGNAELLGLLRQRLAYPLPLARAGRGRRRGAGRALL
jgi:hypothetical protein